MRWRLKAACLDADPNIFFPEAGHTHDTVLAKRVCGRCPVVHECLDYAVSNAMVEGVWGAKTPTEREAIAKERAS